MEESRRAREGPVRRRSTGVSRSADDRARDDWLARSLDRDVRAPLLRAVLWTEHLLADRPEPSSAEDDPRRRGQESVAREIVSALTRIEDLLSIVHPEGEADLESSWPRPIVVRDLVGAALRELDPEIQRRDLTIEVRVTPGDLHLVADPSWTLQAVEALFRAGVRSAPAGAVLVVEATGPEPGESTVDDGARWLRIVVFVTGGELDEAIEESDVGAGQPWRWKGSPTGAVPLAVAAADRYAVLLEGRLRVTRPEEPKGLRLCLRLPADRDPEQRPGWIP